MANNPDNLNNFFESCYHPDGVVKIVKIVGPFSERPD